MRHFGRLLCVALLSLACSRCATPLAPSDIPLDWSGPIAPAQFELLMLRLTRQPNGTLRGKACYFSDGYYVGWSGVPVVIDYPHVSVISGRFVFEGDFQDDRTISGNWAQGTTPHPMTLIPGGNYCGQK